MNALSFKRVVTARVDSLFTGLPFYDDPNFGEAAPPTGYVDVEWDGGLHEPAATGLEIGLRAVSFRAWGPREDSSGNPIQGDGIATSAADRLVSLFRNVELLAPSGDSGDVVYRSHSGPRDLGRDSRGFYRVDTTIVFVNHTET